MESCYGEDMEQRSSIKNRIAIAVTAMYHVYLLIQCQLLFQPGELDRSTHVFTSNLGLADVLLDLDAAECLLPIGQRFFEDTIAL
jgi:hypothetical protein